METLNLLTNQYYTTILAIILLSLLVLNVYAAIKNSRVAKINRGIHNKLKIEEIISSNRANEVEEHSNLVKLRNKELNNIKEELIVKAARLDSRCYELDAREKNIQANEENFANTITLINDMTTDLMTERKKLEKVRQDVQGRLDAFTQARKDAKKEAEQLIDGFISNISNIKDEKEIKPSTIVKNINSDCIPKEDLDKIAKEDKKEDISVLPPAPASSVVYNGVLFKEGSICEIISDKSRPKHNLGIGELVRIDSIGSTWCTVTTKSNAVRVIDCIDLKVTNRKTLTNKKSNGKKKKD